MVNHSTEKVVSDFMVFLEKSKMEHSLTEETRITFRCPKNLVDKLDFIRKGRAGKVSRNQSLVEALEDFVEKNEQIQKITQEAQKVSSKH